MVTIRAATIEDVALLFEMLLASAVEQGAPGELAVTEDDLRVDGFGERPRFQAVVAEVGGETAGMALYFFNYSTWTSRNGLYLEDLYVRPEHRRRGVARALLQHLAKVAVAVKCGRFQWVVLRENGPAVRLYEAMGATALREWWLMSVKGESLRKMAAEE